MRMRRGIALSGALAWGLMSGAAQAYVMGAYSNGLLVPLSVHNGAADTTAVALITDGCDEPNDPTPGATVYWTFFDADSRHVTDGQIQMTDGDVYPFVWANESGLGLEGVEGYLVFVADTDGDGALLGFDVPCLAGEAFHVVAADGDVAYKPAWPVSGADFDTFFAPDLTQLTSTSITTLIEGARDFPIPGGNEWLVMRYSVGTGDHTDLVIWSAEAIGGPGVAYTVNLYDDEQNRRSVNLALPNEEQNVVDPMAIVGRPAEFVNGFIEWRTPDDALAQYVDNGFFPDGNGVVSYSIVRSSAFSARQTIVNPHHP